MEYYLLKSLAILFKIVKWFFLALLLLIIAGILFQYVHDAGRFEYVKHIMVANEEIIGFVHRYLPTNFGGRDMAHFIALIVAFILMSITSNLEYSYDYKARFHRETHDSKELDEIRKSKVGAEKLAVLDEKMHQVEQSASRKEREALLKEFIAIKKQLETMGRNLAFLSVDVVDSTGMKKDEDPLVIAHDFAEYRKFAESKLNAYGCIKAAWTPDGIMACFNTVEEAVKSGQAMIQGLKEFNDPKRKAMKRDFAIRCGINAGYLLFDDTLPLENISDRVIDIAGDMQKYAKPNTIFVPKNLVKPIQSPHKFSSSSKVVDDLDVYEWQPDSNSQPDPDSNDH